MEIIDNRYELFERLGAGGMGTVYRALDHLTQNIVALKRVYVNAPDLGKTTGSSQDPRVALAQEFRMLGTLRHPYIIEVLDYGFDAEGHPYFTMTYLKGARPITEAAQDQSHTEILRLLVQMLQALAYLHQRGIMHRDLKPANVLVWDGDVRVLDFGLAVESTETQETSGTLAYMAPEVLQGGAVTFLADLYAAGVIAYEMFAGQHPFDTANVTHMILQIARERPDLTHLPSIDGTEDGAPALDEIIERLMSKDPQDRYQQAYDVISDLSWAFGQDVPEESAAIRESFLQAARFVGRDAELDRLRQALKQAADHHTGQVWLIGGESGVGKSRLVEELRIQALVNHVLVLRGQGLADGGLSYQLWREPVRRLLLASPPDDFEAGVLKEIVPDIETLLGRPVEDVPPLGNEAHQNRLVSAIVSLVQQQVRPLMFLLEDLQWTEESLEPLKRLLQIIQSAPVLIVGTYRDDERPDLPDSLPGAQAMPLKRLSESEIVELSESMLGDSGRQPEVVDLLQRETEGNVFFLIEVVRTLAEEAGRLNLIGSMTLPASVFAGGVQRVVMYRLNRVPEQAQALLRVAAVAGRYLNLDVLRHILQTDDNLHNMDLDQWLTTCANVAVLEVQDGRWRFVHDKLREGLLDLLSEEQHTTLNRQIAEAVEALYPDDPTQALDLVRYWRGAGNAEKEGHFARIAARNAMKVSALHEALRLLERVLEVIPETDATRAERMDILREIGGVYRRLSDYPTAEGYFRQSLDLARQLDDQAGCVEALNGLGTVADYRGQGEAAQNYFDEALTLSRAIGDKNGIAGALNGLGHVASAQSRYEEARTYYDQVLDLRRALGVRSDYASALNNLGNVAYRLGQYDEALHYYGDCLAIFDDLGDRLSVANTLSNIGLIHDRRGDRETARQKHETALGIRREIGDRLGIAYSLNSLGVMASARGDYEMAETYYQECLGLFHLIGHRRAEATLLNNMGNVALARHDLETARERHLKSMAIKQEIGDRWGVAYSHNNLGRVAFRAGDDAEAEKRHKESIAIKQEIGDRRGIAYSQGDLAFLYARQGDVDQAEACALETLRIAHDLGTVNLVVDALVALACWHQAAERPTQAAELVGLVADHPALHSFTINTHLKPLRATLNEALTEKEFADALAAGAALDFDSVVESLLVESSDG